MGYQTFFLLAIIGFFHLAACAPHSIRDTVYALAPSSQTVELIRYGREADSARHHLQKLRTRAVLSASADNTTADLINLRTYFAAPITIGTQTFYLGVDTGSADTWVADSFYNCAGSSFQSSSYGQASCGLKPTLVRTGCDSSLISWTDRHFDVQYADGTYANGPMGSAVVSLTSDLHLTANVGIASITNIQGNNQTSGLLGLGLSPLTTMFMGTDATTDVYCPFNSSTSIYSYFDERWLECNQRSYSSLADSLTSAESTTSNGTSNSYNNFFTLALSRDSSNTTNGGTLTFGGTPDHSAPSVNASGPWAIVPIEPFGTDDTDTLRHYMISVDGIFLPSYTNTSSSTTTTSSYSIETNSSHHRRSTTNTLSTFDQSNGKAQYIIDSGTTFSLLPKDLAKTFNQLFVPKAYNADRWWQLNCTELSYIPALGLQIGGQVFYHNAEDLVQRVWDYAYDTNEDQLVWTEYCFSAIQEAEETEDGGSLNILGQPFLKNVMAVFDVGDKQMGFAARPYYES